jgi:hypothetical protein
MGLMAADLFGQDAGIGSTNARLNRLGPGLYVWQKLSPIAAGSDAPRQVPCRIGVHQRAHGTLLLEC